MSRIFLRKRPGRLVAAVLAAALAAGLGLAPAIGAAPDEDMAALCAPPPPDVIVTLPFPRLGIPPVWQAFYGSADGARMVGGGAWSADAVMAAMRAGRDGGKGEELRFAILDSRRRVDEKKAQALVTGETPVAVKPVPGGRYAVLSNLAATDKQAARVRIAWHDADGARRNDRMLEGGKENMAGHALAVDEGSGILVAVEAVSPGVPGVEEEAYSLLYRFDGKGRQVWSRSYKAGVSSRLYGAMPLDDGGWLALGDIALADGRRAGMAMRLRADGTIVWQQSYPRGKGAALRHAVAGKGAGGAVYYYILGEAHPTDGEPQAAWLLALDENGISVGQRYFRRPDTVYDSLSLYRFDRGRFLVALNAAPLPGSRQPAHVRVLTLSPRAAMLGDDAYVEGVGARGAAVTPAGDFFALLATVQEGEQPLDIEMEGRTFLIHEGLPALPVRESRDDVDGKSSSGSVSSLREERRAAAARVVNEAERAALAMTGAMPPPAARTVKGWAVMLPPPAPYDDPCVKAP